jgi:integrase
LPTRTRRRAKSWDTARPSAITRSSRRLRLGADWQDHDLVIEHGDGSPAHPDWLTQGFDRLTKRLGLKVRLHDLRHAYATMLLARGVHPKVASEALGHFSTAFTMDTYQHVLPSMGRQAATAVQDELGDALGG